MLLTRVMMEDSHLRRYMCLKTLRMLAARTVPDPDPNHKSNPMGIAALTAKMDVADGLPEVVPAVAGCITRESFDNGDFVHTCLWLLEHCTAGIGRVVCTYGR